MTSGSTEYDIIFAGGGTTSCVIAGRLAAADSTLRILIVENGRSTKDNPAHVQSGRFLDTVMAPGTDIFTAHSAHASARLDGRAPIASNPSCVGGGSSINGLLYNRAPESDYDDWMRLGNPGWGSADLIPLVKKLETYQVSGVGINSTATHGSSGPIKISYGGYETNVGKHFLTAAAAFGRGREFVEDLNHFETCNFYGSLPMFIDAETGR